MRQGSMPISSEIQLKNCLRGPNHVWLLKESPGAEEGSAICVVLMVVDMDDAYWRL